jgi:hypothetical protein
MAGVAQLMVGHPFDTIKVSCRSVRTGMHSHWPSQQHEQHKTCQTKRMFLKLAYTVTPSSTSFAVYSCNYSYQKSGNEGNAISEQQTPFWHGKTVEPAVRSVQSSQKLRSCSSLCSWGAVDKSACNVIMHTWCLQVKLQSQSSAAGAATFNGPLDAAKQVRQQQSA